MIETKATFAKRFGVHRSAVSRWAQAGRLVLTADGKVRVEASLKRWRETGGGRDDVAARHAAKRAAKAAVVQSLGDGAAGAPADPVEVVKTLAAAAAGDGHFAPREKALRTALRSVPVELRGRVQMPGEIWDALCVDVVLALDLPGGVSDALSGAEVEEASDWLYLVACGFYVVAGEEKTADE